MQRILAVSVEGGHLVELRALVPRMAPGAAVDWVTADTPQGRSLLAGERARYTALVGHRDIRGVAGIVPEAVRLLRGRRYDAVVGSGAVSLAFLPVAAAFGTSAHFVESATRFDGPSLTGQVLAAVPGVRTYAQAPGWASDRWPFRGSVFDAYEEGPARAAGAVRRVVVTLGTNPFPFRRLLDRLVAILPADAHVVWQTGSTDASDLPVAARSFMPADELDAEIQRADVVVAHAGAGSALQALDLGKVPVLVPRLAALGEQTDDHQPPLAAELMRRGLAVAVAPEALTLEELHEAAGRSARRRADPPPFVLDGLR
jgi:UDP-N-acetylglucosamine transferase subunit ALG13